MNAVPGVVVIPTLSAATFCQAADGSHLVGGFAALGPIAQPLDALSQPAANVAPATRMAAQQVAHFIEAWRYVSSGLQAYMVNSRENALHFAYYAELRAALSLFAYSGISINQISGCYYLDGAGNRFDFRSAQNNATHRTVWKTWPEWSKRADAQALLAKMKLTAGVSLGDFASALSGYAPATVLNDWGYDLVSGSLADHKARNNSSYDPLLADRPLFQMSDACVQLVEQIWRSLIKGSSGIAFDEDLIIFLADRSIRAITGQTAGHQDYAAARTVMLANVSARTGIDVEAIDQAMTKPYSAMLFDRALEQTSEPENVLSRAFFLLRLASIALEEHLAAPPSTAARLWVRNWLTSVGLFPNDGSMEVGDVLTDYELSLDLFKPTAPHPRGLWDFAMAEHSSRLARPEAFLSWGLTL